MARQIVLLHLVTVSASIASSSYQAAIHPRSASVDVPSRLNMTFYDVKTRSETVIGYLERSGDERLRVIDVAHVEYPDGTNNFVEFVALFDEEALEEFRGFNMERFSKKEQSAERPLSSLKGHLMRSFGSMILKEYGRKSTTDSERYAGGRVLITADNVTINCALYLSRPGVNRAFRLSAVRAELAANDDRHRRLVKPKLQVDRLNELLSNADEVLPRRVYCFRRECRLKTRARQLEAYSNYISPPGGKITPDIWPLTYNSSTQYDMFGLHIINIFHWLTNGTMKYKDRSLEHVSPSLV
ncbi:hypothetical protein FOZ62_017217 [Perkinsus olseni]|uniref:Uncharacterized protein n=1 Tax=Perkinsus olseni TaxID=32597 RepID=A0A7J6QCV0_PEROL|nr:hypothetical protein FOZ62_017217 [Perkinsus olseni]